MVSAAFFSVPSLWGVPLNAIQSPPIDIKEFTASHKFVPESNVRELLNPFENVFENNGWGSLGHHSSHQVQIEPQPSVTSEFQRSINDKFKFGQVKKNEVQEFEMEKILFSDLTYVNVNIPDSYVPTGDELYILDVGEVKFSNCLPLKRTWKPPWPPPYLQSYFCPTDIKISRKRPALEIEYDEVCSPNAVKTLAFDFSPCLNNGQQDALPALHHEILSTIENDAIYALLSLSTFRYKTTNRIGTDVEMNLIEQQIFTTEEINCNKILLLAADSYYYQLTFVTSVPLDALTMTRRSSARTATYRLNRKFVHDDGLTKISIQFEKQNKCQLLFLLPCVSVYDMPAFLLRRNNAPPTQLPHITFDFSVSGMNSRSVSSVDILFHGKYLFARERVLSRKVFALVCPACNVILFFAVRPTSATMKTSEANLIFMVRLAYDVMKIPISILVVRLASVATKFLSGLSGTRKDYINFDGSSCIQLGYLNFLVARLTSVLLSISVMKKLFFIFGYQAITIIGIFFGPSHKLLLVKSSLFSKLVYQTHIFKFPSIFSTCRAIPRL